MPIVQWDAMGLIDPGQSRRGSHHTATLNLCPRRGAVIKQLGLDTGSPETSLGSLVHCVAAHAVCERHGLAGPVDPWRAYNLYSERHQVPVNHSDDLWIRKAIPECLGVLDRQYPDWRPLGIEREVEAYMHPAPEWRWADWIRDPVEHAWKRPGILHTQRLDLVIESLDRVWIVDWKTTYAIRDRTLEEHYLSLQMLSAAYLGHTLFGARFGGVAVIRLQKGDLRIKADPIPGAALAVADVPLSVCWAATVERMFAGKPWRDYPPIFHPAACMGLYGPKSKCPAWNTCAHGIVGV
jgi:hypothetical protein